MLDVKNREQFYTRDVDPMFEMFRSKTKVGFAIGRLAHKHDAHSHPDNSLSDDLEMFGGLICEAWLTPRELIDNRIITYRNENHDLDRYMDDDVMCVEYVRHLHGASGSLFDLMSQRRNGGMLRKANVKMVL